MPERIPQDPRVHTVTPREARKLINQFLPEFSKVRLAKNQKEPLKGMDNAAYLLENGVFVRFARNPDSSGQARREIDLLPTLSKHLSLPIPNIAHAGLQPNGNYFFAYKGIEGEELLRETLNSLSSEQYEKIVADIATFISELRSFPLEEVRKARIIEEGPGEFFEKVLKRLAGSPVNDLTDIERNQIRHVFERYLENKEGNLSYKPSLVHGDLGEPHIRYNVAEHKITGVIDWGGVLFTDPALEIQSLCQEYGEQFARDVLAKLDADVEAELYRAQIYTLARSVNRYLRRVNSTDKEERDKAQRNLRGIRKELNKP